VDLRIGGGRPEDRLATAVFVAALLHGLLILGLRFAAPTQDHRPLPTLEVLLVPDGPPEPDNPEAAYLAARDQRGAGTGLERRRTSLPEASARPIEQAGDARGETLSPPMPESRPAGNRQLAARARAAPHAAGDEERRVAEPASLPVEARPIAQLGVNSTAAEESLHLRGERAPGDLLMAGTRESQIAAYLDAWKRRVEATGTRHFPLEARRGTPKDNPVLEVAVRADGSLQQVQVRRSSGLRELDNAAVGIVRLAGPYDPFPPAMRDRYPVLRFAYEWQFLAPRAASAAAP
jgi:protein TonB